MEAERWQQIESIFQSALDCEPGNRSALLESACGGDVELRKEIESLLASHEKGGFTEPAAFQDGARLLEDRGAHLMTGREVGPYRIIREVGHGGMGTVYLGARADEAFQKFVAIKILRRGLDTEDIIQRFRTERQILATLDHPNITRLLDGGCTEDGLPYLVMEYIEGEPIDQYCDAHMLNITERLELFRGVCGAVSYAHQNLVIHRDIKPGNVLVTKEGVPRLVDFGIAKLLAPGAGSGAATSTMLRPLTPEFASPEQVRGEPITTASDTYSLGVLLYRLLTGRHPYHAATSTAAELEAAICRDEPEKPSLAVMCRDELMTPGDAAASGPRPELSALREGTPERLRRRLAGDLDNIVLMAMRKEPQRRYASADQLSEDIGRHLKDMPVIARRDTRGYRTAKFVRRHKAGVSAAALIFLSLNAGIAGTLWQAHVARQERDRARVEKIKADRTNDFLQELLGFSSGRWFTGNNPKGSKATLADVLDDATARVETELSDQPEVRADIQRTIGDVYANDSKFDLAEHHLRAALETDIKIYGPEHQETARTLDSLGVVRTYRGDYSGGESLFRQALAIYRKQRKDANFDTQWYVVTVANLALLTRNEGRYDEAESLSREGLAGGSRLSGRAYIPVIMMRYQLAAMRADRGDFVEGESLARQAVQEFERIGYQQGEVWAARLYLANILRDEGKQAEAEARMREALAAFLALGEHTSTGFALMNSAYLQYLEGHDAEAEQQAAHALKIFRHSYPNGHPWTAGALTVLGLTLNKTGRAIQAEPMLRESLETRVRLLGKKHYLTAFTQGALGECLGLQKRYVEAEPLLNEAYSTLTSVQKAGSPLAIEAAHRLEAFYTAWGKPQEAARYRRRGL